METTSEITIHQCPRCNESHTYQVVFERTQYPYRKELKKSMPAPVKLYYGDDFTCPNEKENFYARYWLEEDTGETIESIVSIHLLKSS
ncbi:MAG: hypothetical protein MAG431_02058 [Chloroflexi bacterium]|nr:hypothetical protein [Chloroflexota bacterium]